MDCSSNYDPRTHGALCDDCPLNGRTVVPPQSVPNADRAIVGEAPGYREEIELKPFVGQSGQYLDRLLSSHGLKRSNIHVTNATLCRAPEIGGEPDKKKINKAAKCCRPRLLGELKKLKPNAKVLAMGAVGVRAVAGRVVRILRARGFIWPAKLLKNYETEPSFTLYSTIHPAFVLRSPIWEPIIHSDFDRWARSARPMDLEGTEVHLAPTRSKIRRILRRLGKIISVDVETSKDAPTIAKLLCIGISDGKIAIVIPWGDHYHDQGQIKTWINTCFKSRTVVTHNGPGFDHIVLNREGIRIEAWEDTLIAHHAFAGHMPQRLDHVVSMYIDALPWKITARAKDDERGVWDPEKIESDDLFFYNATDSHYTINSWHRMQGDLAPFKDLYEQDKELAQIARSMQEIGIAVDEEERWKLDDVLRRRQAYYLGRLRNQAGFDLKPTKLDDLRKALFKILHAPVLYRSTITGVAATNIDTLQHLGLMKTAAGRFCRLLMEWRSTWKTHAVYVKKLPIEADGRVHASWRAWGTVSGRFSCQKPALQTLEKDSGVRALYVPRPGYVFVGFDAKQLEARIAAYLSCDEKLIYAVESEDVHLANARVLFGELPTDPARRKLLRDAGKQGNFAMFYLAEAKTVHARMTAQGLDVSLDQVQAALNRLRSTYTRYYEFVDENLIKVQKLGYIDSWDGRRRYTGHVPIPTEIANFPIQTGAAGWMNDVLIALNDELPKDVLILAQAHDHALLEVPERKAEKIAKMAKAIAERPVDLKSGSGPRSYPVDVKIGRNWKEAS